MDNKEIRDIDRIRLRLIDLIKSFFVEEPDAERLSRWRGVFAALNQEQINVDLDKTVQEITRLLDELTLKEIQDEYYNVFGDPFGKNIVDLTASYYADGRSHGQTLADFRGFLNDTGLIKNKKVIEAEDSLTVMLDFLASMIELNGEEGGDTDKYQGTLVNRYLAPLALSFSEALEKNPASNFYAVCSRFLVGYVELEKGLFELV